MVCHVQCSSEVAGLFSTDKTITMETATMAKRSQNRNISNVTNRHRNRDIALAKTQLHIHVCYAKGSCDRIVELF